MIRLIYVIAILLASVACTTAPKSNSGVADSREYQEHLDMLERIDRLR